MADIAFTDALVYYRMKYPTKESLGSGSPPSIWAADVEALSRIALDPVTGTSTTFESGSVAGQLNFAQIHRVRALHARRAELDADYANPYTEPASQPGQRMGFVVQVPL